MDVFKQISPNEIKTTDNFSSLTGILSAYGKTVGDLLGDYNDAGRLSKLLGRSIREVDEYLHALNEEISVPEDDLSIITRTDTIPTGLPSLDDQLGGGIPIGTVTEVFGASGCGKSHLLSQLAVNSVTEEANECIYICTESFLETRRLKEISDHVNGSLDTISYIYCPDLESQDHILFTQLPTKLQQSPKAKLVIIDSIAQHLRREGAVITSTYLNSRIKKQVDILSQYDDYDKIKEYHDQMLKKLSRSQKYANRSSKSYYLLLLYRHLTRLANEHQVAIVVVNQVSDHTVTPGESNLYEETDDAFNLDFQNSIIAGWENKKIYEHLTSFQSSVIVNSNDEFMLQYELENSVANPHKLVGTAGQKREYQISLIEKLNNLKNGGSSKQVPTLGHIWGKRITTRILLSKSYKPILTELDTQLENELSDTLPTLKSWEVERFAKVVSKTSGIYNDHPKVRFEIINTGLKQIE